MDDLDRLHLAAAVTSGWPALEVEAPDEPALLAARALAEAVLGPLPQAEEWEPWAEEPWGLHVDLPGAEATALAVALAALRAAGHAARVVPGRSPGERWALERGAADDTWIGAGPVRARLTVDPATGGDGRLDLRHGRGDAALAALSDALALALQAAGLPHPFASDDGPDRVQAVVHRPTGRLGVRLALPAAAEADRDAIVDAIGAVVRARAAHPEVRLAPDLRWDVADGFALTAWLVAPPAAPLPGDALDPPDRDALLALLAGLGGAADGLELHVVPAGALDGAVEAVAAWPLPGEPLVGAAPRWVGSPPRLAACWSVDVDAAPPAALADLVARVAEDPRVAAIRLVPAAPDGLLGRWGRLDPAWRVRGDVAFLRVRDPVGDRDLLPDGPVAVPPPWALAWRGLPGVRDLRGLTAADERVGLALDLGPEAADAAVLDAALTAIAAARPPQASTLAIWGHRGERTWVHLLPARAGEAR